MPLITATKIARFVLYGPFGPISTILAAESGKTIKNKVVQNPTLTCYRFTVLTFKYVFWE